MEDSILDRVIDFSRRRLDLAGDAPHVRQLKERLAVFERAALHLRLEPARPEVLGRFVALLLDLRDEVLTLERV